MAVLKEARGQGIGTKLMAKALTFLSEQGYEEVIISPTYRKNSSKSYLH
ncbi:MAG: GNAT family N-acetyltransferase [Spirulinaceae cyanobacterium]